MTTTTETQQEEEREESIPSRIHLPTSDVTLEQLLQFWKDQELYVNYLEEKLNSSKDLDEKGKVDGSKRENLLVMRLTAKEQEIQELAAQVAELKSSQAPTSALLRSTLLDPAVNLLIQKLTKECENLKKQAEDKRNELAAWKFTPDSATGKRLMAKCRQLYQENEDLGKMISSGRLAKLEGELAIQKNLTDEMKQSQMEMDDFMTELDEDMEGMQSTIAYLQQQLREAKEEISRLNSELGKEGKGELEKPAREAENSRLKADEEEAEVEQEQTEAEDSEKRKHSELTDEEDPEESPKSKRSRNSQRTSENSEENV